MWLSAGRFAVVNLPDAVASTGFGVGEVKSTCFDPKDATPSYKVAWRRQDGKQFVDWGGTGADSFSWVERRSVICHFRKFEGKHGTLLPSAELQAASDAVAAHRKQHAAGASGFGASDGGGGSGSGSGSGGWLSVAVAEQVEGGGAGSGSGFGRRSAAAPAAAQSSRASQKRSHSEAFPLSTASAASKPKVAKTAAASAHSGSSGSGSSVAGSSLGAASARARPGRPSTVQASKLSKARAKDVSVGTDGEDE